MPNVLRDSIQQMAAAFASAVLQAVRSASLEDVHHESRSQAAHAAPALRAAKARVATHAPAAKKSAAPAVASAPARLGRKGRLGRRSSSDIASVIVRIVSLLDGHPGGLRAEQIRSSLSLLSKEMPRPIAEALAAKKISKVGEKRATTYFAGAGKGRGAAPKASGTAKDASKASRGGKASGRAAGAAAASAAPKRRGRPPKNAV